MKNIPLLLGTIIGSILLIVGIAFFFSGSSQVSQEVLTVSPEQVASEARHIKGATESASAKVQIVEFSDFQCPACRSALPSVESVMQQYGDQVQFIYRHFPLDSIHPNARDAALSAELASQYGKFWEMHDLLFANQDTWGRIASRDELYQTFSDYAEQLQIDKQEFLEKIKDNQEIRDLVQSDFQLANDLSVSATPTFYVNGQQTTAPQLLQAVSSVLEADAE